jgi:hypothetical protein
MAGNLVAETIIFKQKRRRRVLKTKENSFLFPPPHDVWMVGFVGANCEWIRRPRREDLEARQ